jgi:PAS domain S-box-containing protein
MNPASDTFFTGKGEMARLMRTVDWSQTLLGAIETWSQSLRTALSICLNSRFPMVIWWGKELVLLYNDAWQPILGTKHPNSLGKPGQQVWPEIWHIIGAQLNSVLETGEATWSDDMLLLVDRFGYVEEAYFTYSYSPIFLETGEVGGAFSAVTETTQRVIGERRLSTLRELAANTVEAKTVNQTCCIACATLANNPYDIPFALLYLVKDDGNIARLTSTSGIKAGTPASPEEVDLTQDTDLWRLSQVQETTEAVLIDDLKTRFGDLPGGAWEEPSQYGMVLPITQSGQKQKLTGLLVLGISPQREFDDKYRGFFDLVASHVATAITDASAYEDARKRAETLAELDRAKTVFFSNISHEFRTPLTLILGPLEDLLSHRSEPLPVNDREHLEIIHRNSLRLLKLVNNLLDFSRIEAGRIQAVYESVDLSSFTAQLASMFRSAIERAGLQLIVDCPPLPEFIYVDREMWEKVVLNLLSNAFKFTFEGEITVVLRWLGNFVELVVKDTGTGIPADEIPHLFKRFHRVPGARSRTNEGSGIGLSLVQELVKLHGGEITVTSEVDQGTCFAVSIPTGNKHLPPDRISVTRTLDSTATSAASYVEEALRWFPEEQRLDSARRPDAQKPGSSASIPFGCAQGKPFGCAQLALSAAEAGKPLDVRVVRSRGEKSGTARILVADDNADMRDYLKRLLGQQYEVEAVGDGIGALAAVQRERPNLILSDMMMPRLDGFALLSKLRNDLSTRDIPIILLSARAGEESRIQGLEAGADDYLIKPFSARELLARVEANLKLAQLRREAVQQEQLLRQEAETTKNYVETILSSINDGFYVFDRNWRFSYVNDRLCEMAGMQREAILGQSVWDLFPDVVGTEVDVQFHRALTEQISLQFEYYYSTWERWYEYRVYPLSDGLAIFTTEITERKQANLLLVEQKKLLEMIASGRSLDECLSSACASVSKLNPHTRACILLADTQRLTFPRSITPDFPSSFGQGLKDAPINDLCIGTCGEAVFAGKPVTCADIAGDDRWSKEWRDLCVAHGVLACHSTPIFTADDPPLGSLMLCFNEARMPTDWEQQLADFVTQVASIVFEREQASLAVRESEERLRRALAIETVGVIFFKTDGSITETNDAFLRMSGYSREDCEQGLVRWDKMTPPEWMPHSLLAVKEFNAVGRTTPYEKQYIRKDGSRWWALFAAMRLNEAEGVEFVIDITERKQAEAEREQLLAREQAARAEAERANRIKDEFLAVLSHELRSPLNPILGWATILQTREYDSQRLKKALATIERNAKLQVQLIDDLLDVSRILQGKLKLNTTSVNLVTVIEAAIETVHLAAEAKAIQVQTVLDNSVGSVLGDAGRLQQVIWNLLSNAVKFTPQGGQVSIHLECVGGQAQITVSDTGQGIHSDFLPQVFDYFRQADSTTTRKFGGLGLGLAIVRHLVELHGGTVKAESPGEGQGATFTVSLPLLNQIAESTHHSDSFSCSTGELLPLTGLKILVVDDEPDSQDFITFVLEQHGAEVMALPSAIHALQILEHNQFDLIISDIGMPVMDGYMLIKYIRTQLSSPCRKMLAIALTAYAGEANERQVLKAGFQKHLAKPVDPTDLVDAITHLIITS